MVRSVGKWDEGARVMQAHETPCTWQVGEQHYIAPDYSGIAWYTAKRQYSPPRERSPLAAIAFGIVAALIVVAVSAVLS